MLRVAINGFGRIGRVALRLLQDEKNVQVVAINNRTPGNEQLAYLYKYDSSHRTLKGKVSYNDDGLIVKGKKIKVFAEEDPSKLPWGKLKVDVVLECTGAFTSKEACQAHIKAGAKHVIISAPAKDDAKTIVYGVNHKTLTKNDKIISAASCTTNCLAPVLKVIDDKYHIVKGFMTTVHAMTNDQETLDIAHKKGIYSRRGRAASLNIIPTSTGAASQIGKVIPHLNGKMDGNAFRVPVGDGSVVDVTVEVEKHVTVEDVNKAFFNNQSKTLRFSKEPLVSSDIIGDTHGSLFDATQTMVTKISDDLYQVQVVSWYDNENSYTSQMVRTIKYFAELK